MRPTAPQDGPFGQVSAPPGAPITGAATPPAPPPAAHAASSGPLSFFNRQPSHVPATSEEGQVASLGKGRFLWPVRGEIVSRYGFHGAGQQNDGLNIGASAGQGVKAAAAGEVVYAGNSLPDFGNLVLIKHPDGWVTAYGHLAAIEVKMRQSVAQGQEIGRVGQTGGVDRPQLHFEIRYSANAREKAKPVDPSLILP
jgi:murein DD-endopeptidase MepM/ murein hydrolase activator NlpD